MALEVGFGTGVITPELPVVLAGFGARKGWATEVHDELMACAVVFRDGATTTCLLVLDLLLLGADLAGPVRRAVAEALACLPEHVMTSCTHTHAGPAATKAVRRAGWPMPEGYVERLVDGCVTAARAAVAAAEPARLSDGRGSLPEELSVNRRGLPYDPVVSVLQARRLDGSLLGTLGGAGIHPVALGVTCRQVSGDWVTTFRERTTAATGAPAVLVPGALGDVNPARDPHTDPDPGGNWETAAFLGSEVAETVLSLGTEPLPASLDVLPRRVVPLRAGLTVPALLNKVALRRVGIELLEWSLGGVRLVSVPGEAFHALGLAIEGARGDRAMLAGLAPEYHGYLPAPFRHGYEEKMSYGGRFVAGLQRALVEPR